MSPHRARETGHGLGFALLALGLAVAPLAGWEVFPGVFGLGMAGAGLLLVAVARRLGPPAPGPSWTHDRAVGFFSGLATFWMLFLVTGSSVGALGPQVDTSPAPPAGLAAIGTHSHTFLLDPSEYIALGASPSSASPSWALPNGTLRAEGSATWNASSGLTRLHVSLEAWHPGRGWAEVERWTVRPGEAFAAAIPKEPLRQPELVRLTLLPDASTPVFHPVEVQARLTLLA